MNKGELIKIMAEKAGFTNKDAAIAYDAFIETVTEALKAGEKVQLVGFGTFEVSERAAREGRNPLTGEAMKIKASKTPKFKAGKALKDAINAPAKKGKKK
jgi:DNA-binding protein HU-beta